MHTTGLHTAHQHLQSKPSHTGNRTSPSGPRGAAVARAAGAPPAGGGGGDGAPAEPRPASGRVRLYRQPKQRFISREPETEQQPQQPVEPPAPRSDAPASNGGTETRPRQRPPTKEELMNWDLAAAFGDEAEAWDVLPPAETPAWGSRSGRGSGGGVDGTQSPRSGSGGGGRGRREGDGGSPTAAASSGGAKPRQEESVDLGDEAVPPSHIWKIELEHFQVGSALAA
jgi:hypothetical protein